MTRSYIIIIKFILILNIFLVFLNYLLLVKYQIVLQAFSITPYTILSYTILSYIIVNILKEYENRNKLFHNRHHFIRMNYTVWIILKKQLKDWWDWVIFKTEQTDSKLIILIYFLKSYEKYLTLSHLLMFLLNLFINLMFLPIKLITYTTLLIVLLIKYFSWIKFSDGIDILSGSEYSIIETYSIFNVNNIKEFFDEYDNLNCNYIEEFKHENFTKYLLIWLIMELILKPYFISFNHLVVITYIFSSKQLKTFPELNDEDEVIFLFEKTNNIFSFKTRCVLFIFYVVNTWFGLIVRYFSNYKNYVRNLSIEDYYVSNNNTLCNNFKFILISSLHLGDLKYIRLSYWRAFKIQINFYHAGHRQKNFVKKLTKDNKNYIYVYPLRIYGKIPLRLVEVFNLLYFILYNSKE